MIEAGVEVDGYLSNLRDARRSPAVIKTRLANLRANLPEIAIFVCEGKDDKAIYAQWIERLRPGLAFEPFPCDGKKYVLALKQSLDKDLTGLQKGVYFFVDRDFDDLAGIPTAPNLFMTDGYSVENYLVHRVVLQAVMTMELECHAEPVVRERVLDKFDALYESFLNATSDLNFRIFCARRLGIGVVGGLPDKISKIAEISLDDIALAARKLDEIVVLSREPEADEMDGLRAEFDALDRRMRFRGKFAFGFFLRIIDLLAEERIRRSTPLMDGATPVTRTRRHEISATILASRSPMPVGLAAFIATV